MTDSFALANLALQAVCPSNVILADEKGLPSVMVKIPKMTYAQLGLGDSNAVHPAFLVNGRELDCIYVSKFGNVLHEGNACSLPGVEPASKIRFDDAADACRKKGKGWHLMTKAEFSVLALWCARQGHLPWGNNREGRDYRESGISAVQVGDGHTETGTGPLTWYHNRSLDGVADLNGNTSNWMGGVRLFYGELQVVANAADSNNAQTPDSGMWRAVDGATGALIVPDGRGTTQNSVKLDFNDQVWKKSGTCGWKWVMGEQRNRIDKKRASEFANVQVDEAICPEVVQMLQAHTLLPYSPDPFTYGHCKMYANNGGGDVRFHCGGSFHDHCDAGVFWNRAVDDTEHGTAGIGFRCAYINL